MSYDFKIVGKDVISLEYTLVNQDLGFFSLHFSNGESVQCCLLQEDLEYLNTIVADDLGFDWGICYDVNRWIFDYLSHDEVAELILTYAQKAEINIV